MTDTSAWIPAAIAAAAAIVVAIIEYFTTLRQKRQSELFKQYAENAEKERKETESRAEARRKESLLNMELMNATCKLCMITAKKLTNQHVNGDVKEAMDAAGEAQKNYDTFLKKETCKLISS